MIERIFILINKDHGKFLSNNTFIKIKYVISNLSEKYKIHKKKKEEIIYYCFCTFYFQ